MDLAAIGCIALLWFGYKAAMHLRGAPDHHRAMGRVFELGERFAGRHFGIAYTLSTATMSVRGDIERIIEHVADPVAAPWHGRRSVHETLYRLNKLVRITDQAFVELEVLKPDEAREIMRALGR